MPVELTLWPACVKTHGFADQLAAAAEAGYHTLAMGPLTYRKLLQEGCSPAEIRRMARDHGVKLGHYDGFARWARYPFAQGTPSAAKEVFADSVDECLQTCQDLELAAICATGVYDPLEAEQSCLIDDFGEFCEKAARCGVQVDLEGIPMWGVPDLASAWAIVEGSGCNNAAVLLDSWHFFRGSADWELLRAMPAGSIRTVQLADARELPPERSLLEDCLGYRLLPGEGDIPLKTLLGILKDKGGIYSFGPEVFSHELDALDARTAAARCERATRKVISAVYSAAGGTPAADNDSNITME
ncbi:sugar phosphate isomerase/epimerase family protein [Parahaliea aestuarii]|uniref:Sugar phosphate isomerase/epimerase n=1 Tax=Parahaliea aestuarii TaxID=1852021 RepID=A0A5C9A770_9GAMM|nr:sugar phosphate isomerase/epimerase family protein [Parahaliea aestuarii]TXS95061.1 sugar phosphate isomerase/epimerase [Parahaliea aestuarii]